MKRVNDLRVHNKIAGAMGEVNPGMKFKIIKSRKFPVGSIVKAITGMMQFAYASPWSVKCEDKKGNQGWVQLINLQQV